MKNFINKQMEKIKEYLTKGVSLSPIVLGVTLIVFVTALCISYNAGSNYKLNSLVDKEAQTQLEELKQSNLKVILDIEKLSAQKEELNNTLSDKSSIQTAMQEYNKNKAEHTNQISKLDNDIKSLDTSIQQKQAELDKKKAAKAEELRIANEKASASSNSNQSYTVYITNTGSKYHSSGCQYLKKSKIAISKDNAVAQGYTPCSRCRP